MKFPFNFRTEERDGGAVIVAGGPTRQNIAAELHRRLVERVDMEFARQLVRLGWTPPPGHAVLREPTTGPMQQQHVIDWWRSQGYRVIELSDGSLMCVSTMATATGDKEAMAHAFERRFKSKWARE